MRTFAELAPVLLEGESGATYASILAQVTAAIGPKDIIDEFCVRDVADLEWEALRLRRLKANLLNSSLAAGLVKLIEPLLKDSSQAQRLAFAWHAHNIKARKRVERLLKKAGHSMDAALAQTLSQKLDDVERIDRLLASAEARRHQALREFDRHRDAVLRGLQTALKPIEDAQYAEVPA